MLSKEQLLEIFEYKDGELYWKTHTGNRYKTNKIAGYLHPSGYKYTGVLGKRYKNHRIIWMMHYGFLPKEIDHIDRNKQNNRIENLRESNRVLNMQNVDMRKNNSSGFKNVYWHKGNKQWQVKMNIDKKTKLFGYFDNLELAGLVAEEARNKHHKYFAKLRGAN